ncbi:MAG: hypothetical protein ACREEM_28465 [Blastocatellia bacterium]
MWKQLLDALLTIFKFAHRLERQEQALKDQQQENRELTAVVQWMGVELQRTQDEMRRMQEREADTRRMLLLEVENQILKAKLQLPPARDKDRESAENS